MVSNPSAIPPLCVINLDLVQVCPLLHIALGESGAALSQSSTVLFPLPVYGLRIAHGSHLWPRIMKGGLTGSFWDRLSCS